MSATIHSRIHSRRGQTLVEALVALTILTTGFIGIATLLTKSFQINRISSNDTQATYLASEGIEVVKSLIDHDVYENLAGIGGGWGSCFSDGTAYYLGIDYTTTDCTKLVPSATSQPQPLYFDTVTHLYTVTKGVNSIATNFTRSIKITDINNGDDQEIDVQSVVTWNSEGLSNTIVLEDQFYNWHPPAD